MSIKLKHLCLTHKKHPDQVHLWWLQEEEINTSPLKADGNQEVFDFTPSLFSIKEAWILTQAKWFFAGALAHHFLSLLAFRVRLLFHAPATCLSIIGLSYNKPCEIWLGNVYFNPKLPIYPSSEMTAINVSSCLFFLLILPYYSEFLHLVSFFLFSSSFVLPLPPSSSSLFVLIKGNHKKYSTQFSLPWWQGTSFPSHWAAFPDFWPQVSDWQRVICQLLRWDLDW